MAVTQARLGILRLNAGRLNFVAPTVPHSPVPPHLSYAGPLTLQWQGAGHLFDVYFGTTTPPPYVGTTPSRAWVAPPLTLGTVYFWQVVAHANALGPIGVGPVWQFTATAPVAPIYLAPPNHSVNQATTGLVLQWEHPVVSAGDTVFDVYFGPVASDLPLVSRGQTAKTFNLGTLKDGVDYYWRVVSRNNAASVSGPTWTFETRNPTKGLITIGGVDVRARTRIAGMSIRDLLADTPNTASFTIQGTAPTVGKEVRIGLATLAGDDVIFGGYIDTVEAIYEGRPENRAWRITAQDYTYGLNRRKVRTRYGQGSATAIALDLLAGWAPSGYTGTHIAAGLPIVTGGIDFTEEDLTSCFARLAQRIGGYWYVDYARDVHLFLTEATDAPTPITRAARVLLADPPIHWSTDLTQIRTRVYVEGGGSEARNVVVPGATTLPVTDGHWYSQTGGTVVSGPQRITYTGKAAVAGGPAPTAVGQAIVGALGAGPYAYMTSAITDGAETPQSAASAPVTLTAVASPTTPIAITPIVGLVAAPASGPTLAPSSSQVAAPSSAPGLTANSSEVAAPSTAPYAVGARPATGGLADPYGNPGVPVIVDSGSGTLFPGAPPTVNYSYYFWSISYTNAAGETLKSPNSAMLSFNNMSQPSFNAQMAIPAAPTGQGITAIKVYRRQSNENTWYLAGSIGPGGGTFKDTKPRNQLGAEPPLTNTTWTPGGGALTPGTYYWTVVFQTSNGATTAGPGGQYTISATQPVYSAAQLSNIPVSSDGRVTARRIYRTRVNQSGSSYGLEATINDNTTTTFLSQMADASLGAAPPTSNTTATGPLLAGTYGWRVTFVTASGETTGGPSASAGLGAQGTITLSAIPTSGDGRVVARRLYRTGVNGSGFYLENTLNDNTTTTYTSQKTDGQLGASLPASNTTGTGKLSPGATYGWQVTFATASGETTPGPYVEVGLGGSHDAVNLSQIPTSGDVRVTKRKLYRTAAGGGPTRLEATLNDNVTTTYLSGPVSDGALGATAPTSNNTGSGGLQPGHYYWTYRFITASGYSNGAPPSEITLAATTDTAQLSGIAVSPDARVTKRQVFRTTVNGGTFKLEAEINDNTTTVYTSSKRDDQLGADLVWGNTTSASGQIAVSNIRVGAAGTTARRLYRTTSGGASFLLVATISDNTTTTYQDNKADTALGGVAASDPIIELVGIPASGAGSVRYEIRPGDEVNLFVQCDDAAAQSALAALEGPPSQGIVEHVLQDRRLGLSEARAIGMADLALFARPIVTINYATRDPKTRSGKTVRIDLPELSLVGDFTIQTVEIDEIDMHPGLHPQHRVTCSSVRFSFEDAVRRFKLDDH